MNKRVVTLDKAEKCLAGHPKFLPALRQEYAYPDAFGNMNDIIQEADDLAAGDDMVFDAEITEFIGLSESTRYNFVLLAMLGITPED